MILTDSTVFTAWTPNDTKLMFYTINRGGVLPILVLITD